MVFNFFFSPFGYKKARSYGILGIKNNAVWTFSSNCVRVINMGWEMGIEPTTFGTTIRRSNQLSYVHRFTARFFRTACKFNTLFDYCKIFAADSSRKRGTVRLRFLFFRCPQGDLSGMGRFAGLPFSGRRRPASGGPLFLADYLINLPDKERLWKNVPVSSGSTGGRCS